MKSSELHSTFLQLVRLGIGTGSESIQGSVDWAAIKDLADRQGLSAVVLDGIEEVRSKTADELRACLPEHPWSARRCELPPQEMLLEWIGEVMYQTNQYKQQWEVANKLAEWWSKEGISATVIKGRSIAQYYPNPEHRYSCDLDVFIEEGWDKACKILEDKGIELEHEVYKEVEFTLDGIYVECHRYITPVRGNETLLRFEKYLRSLLNPDRGQVPVRIFQSKASIVKAPDDPDKNPDKGQVPVRFEGSKLLKPSLMFTSMLFIEHALGDFLHGKLTLKHIVDWIVLRRQTLTGEVLCTLTGDRYMSERGFCQIGSSDTYQSPVRAINERCEEFRFDRFLALLNAIADVVEGKREYNDLSADYREAFDELFQHPDRGQEPVSFFQGKEPVRNTDNQTWFRRRVGLFFDIVKNRSKYKKYGYCSMEKFLFNAMWAHFFKKKVVL